MKSYYGCFFAAALCAWSVGGYRYICNGILANGEERGDDPCGICDDEHAARWENPNLAIVVDEETLPKGIKQHEWLEAVRESFAAWEVVSGSDLRFFQLSTQSIRQFGANDGLHEIYWVTDKEEWRKLLGAGEYTTFGATLPRYACGGHLGSKRRIFDADMVLNGVPGIINWRLDCEDDDCMSIQTTLVHELGHFFGLDHPCVSCGTSVMSARPGYGLNFPAFDDMEGLRKLYPDHSKKGGFGFPCITDNECESGHQCIQDQANHYCSTGCNVDGDCDPGAVCSPKNGRRMCTFIDRESALGKKEGDNCMRVPCEPPLECVGAGEPNFYCFTPCREKKDCQKSGQECIKIESDLSICLGIKNKGDQCNHRELCDEDLYCLFDNILTGHCRAPCGYAGTSSGCEEGEICEIIDGLMWICIPEEDELHLDDASHGFDEGKERTERTERTEPKESKKNKERSEYSLGCASLGSQDLLWLLLGFWMLVRLINFRKRRQLVKNTDEKAVANMESILKLVRKK